MSDNAMNSSWANDLDTGVSDLLRLGLKTVFFGLGVLCLWTFFVPLSSAVVASGSVKSKGENKVIQHRAGGIISAINAKDGERVTAGDVIMELNPVIDQVELTRLQSRKKLLLASKARLVGEQNFLSFEAEGDFANFSLRGSNETSIDDEGNYQLANLDDQAYQGEIFSEQAREFDSGRKAILAEVEALERRSEGMEQELKGLKQRVGQVTSQVDILSDQYNGAQELFNNGHIAQQELWNIQSNLLDRRSEYAALSAQYKSTAKSIDEVDSQIEQILMRDQQRASEQLSEVITELQQIDDQLSAAQLTVEQTKLRAPVTGILVHNKFTTIGGVVGGGDVIAEIVPDGSSLEAKARITPKDIGSVFIGQEAEVLISALNPRIYDPLPAKVTYIAADSIVDENTGEPFFEVNVSISELPKGPEGVQLVAPGMTGEVFLSGETRTFASYIMRPFKDSFARAFTEK